MMKLSSYASNLEKETKAHYEEKISLINGVDSFGKVTEGIRFDDYPPVEDYDLVSYMASFISMDQFKARKGLEAYNQLVSGWIKEVTVRKIAEKLLITSRVSCSLLR